MDSSRPEVRDTLLGWLRHGIELARELRGERARAVDVIWSLLSEAVDMLDRVPDQERRWLSSGTRSGGWGMVGLTAADLREIERLRTLSAMRPHDGTTRYSPQRNDVERALGVLEWLRWCNGDRNARRLVQAAVALAKGGDTQVVYRLYAPNRRRHDRQTVYEIRTKVAGYILNALRREHRIGFADGLILTDT